MAKITRAEAVAFINKQFNKTPAQVVKTKAGAYGYGRVELREVLDAIYGAPTKDTEELRGCSDR